MDKQLRILFVTPHWLLAPTYGGQQRALNVARLLNRFGSLSVVIASPEPADEETVRRTKREFEVGMAASQVPVPSGTLWEGIRNRLRHEWDPKYLATDPHTVSKTDRRTLLELIEQHDVIWVHTIKTANLFRIWRWPHSVLDVDDLPSRFYGFAAKSGRNPARRLLDFRMSWVWRRREHLLTERFDVVTVCSEDDRRYLGGPAQVHVIPNGFHPPAVVRRDLSGAPRIGFIGIFNWPPNAEGMRWFICEAWPLIKRQLPHAQLRLVGRGSNGSLTRLGPDITGLGWLEDPTEEIASWSAMIIPIQVGGGTRIKIAEGFARKCPVVATTVGAFGYDVRNGEEILLADSPQDFAAACIRLLCDPREAEALSERAHKRFLERWTWDSHEGAVGNAIRECLARSQSTTAEPSALRSA